MPGPLTRAANGCSASTTRKQNSTTRRKNLFMLRSCYRPMRRPDLQTGQRSGTLWKPWRTNGTPSLPGVSCWRSRWRCRRNSIFPCLGFPHPAVLAQRFLRLLAQLQVGNLIVSVLDVGHGIVHLACSFLGWLRALHFGR